MVMRLTSWGPTPSAKGAARRLGLDHLSRHSATAITAIKPFVLLASLFCSYKRLLCDILLTAQQSTGWPLCTVPRWPP